MNYSLTLFLTKTSLVSQCSALIVFRVCVHVEQTLLEIDVCVSEAQLTILHDH